MAHIADFMVDTKISVGLNNYIARELSPHSLQDAATETPTEEKEKYVWRMHQPIESRKYQLFPAKDKLSITAGRKSPDSETAATGQLAEKVSLGGALRTKPKEQTLVRRRKVSVPELGPMTTVQEIAMDSPTIPGRPPLHERSISAPGNSWRHHVFGESMLSCISGPALDENAEMAESDSNTQTQGQANDDSQNTPKQTGTSSPKQPLSPKTLLTPLVIPSSSAPQPRLTSQSSSSRLRSGSTPPDVPPKSARMLDHSPHPRASPYTPNSASTLSLSTAPTSVSNTPLSAHPNSAQPTSAIEGRSSPKPAPMSAGSTSNPMGHSRGQSETSHRAGYSMGHRRGESEASIMDRGRPKKRPDGSPMTMKRRPSLRTASAEEQKAFETLPQGMRATSASTLLPANEIEILRKQAIGQASRFEVLNSKDVDALSRELRGLDERCEYLRKTHRSLRSGRRNLHDRICTYLRSPRVARFSHESILKQEEALSELDTSIDDWVSKLEQAENRRTRVRQKLLEHVAGALLLNPQSPTSASSPNDERKSMAEMNTPPRSPTKSQSPQRLAAPVQVSSPEPISRRDVESIRIYADSDISALLKDVEEEISRMEGERQKGNYTPTPSATPVLERSQERERRGRVDESEAVRAGVMLNAVAFQPQPCGLPEFV